MLRRILKILHYPRRYFIERLANELDANAVEKEVRRKEELMSQFMHCGVGVRLNGHIVMTGPENISIGDNVHIGDNAFIRAEGGIEIGDNTHISRNMVVYSVNHDYLGSQLPYDENLIKKPVRIGRNVWIGMNVCITPGASIGDGAIIGLGTIVFGEVPPQAIIGSAPWKQIGTRDRNHYTRLDEARFYGGPNGIAFCPSDNQEY